MWNVLRKVSGMQVSIQQMLAAIIILFMIVIIIFIWKDVSTLPRIKEVKIRTKIIIFTPIRLANMKLLKRHYHWQEEDGEADTQTDVCGSENGFHFLEGNSGQMCPSAWKVYTPWHKFYLRDLS